MRASRFRQQLQAKEPGTPLCETVAWEPGSPHCVQSSSQDSIVNNDEGHWGLKISGTNAKASDNLNARVTKRKIDLAFLTTDTGDDFKDKVIVIIIAALDHPDPLNVLL